jgi:hypothetical protein
MYLTLHLFWVFLLFCTAINFCSVFFQSHVLKSRITRTMGVKVFFKLHFNFSENYWNIS